MARCIFCRVEIPLDPGRPACVACDGTCSAVNRFSPVEVTPMFCHRCGEPCPVSVEHPFCDACMAHAPVTRSREG